jgi:hypothetical protein
MHTYMIWDMLYLLCFLVDRKEIFYIGLNFYITESTSPYNMQVQGESSHTSSTRSYLGR